MHNHATSQKRPPALALSYPNLPRRVGECIFGSMRRDAIKALRAATAEQWSYSSEPVPSVCVGTGISHSVLFQYDADTTLTSVQLTSTQGHLDITGDCDLARRLNRFATRALSTLLQRTVLECEADLRRFATGDLAANSQYQHYHLHRHIPKDGYDDTDTKTAVIELSAGNTFAITAKTSKYRLPIQEREALERGRVGWSARTEAHSECLINGGEGFDSQLPCLPLDALPYSGQPSNPEHWPSYFLPELPCDRGTATSLKAELKNRHLDDLARLFRIDSLHDRFLQVRMTDAMLAKALTQAERSNSTPS